MALEKIPKGPEKTETHLTWRHVPFHELSGGCLIHYSFKSIEYLTKFFQDPPSFLLAHGNLWDHSKHRRD